ncbi:MAG: glycosyltransferase family 4 protein [Caldilineaceae bacterium]
MWRIVYVAPFGLGQKTTVWARTLPLARYLAQQGHTVTLLIPPWDTPQDAGKRWQDEGVEVVNVSLSGGIPMIMARLLKEVRRRQPHLVHIVKPRAHAGLVQWWLWQQQRWSWGPSQKDKPKIVLDVDDWEQAWAVINPYPPPVARFLAWQEEWGIRHAHAIIAASQWLVERVQQYTPQTPVCYLPNGVTPLEGTDAAAPDEMGCSTPEILFFSRYVEVTPVWLARFWGALVQHRPDAHLTVFGDAFQPGRVQAFQQVMHQVAERAAPRVTWLPYSAPAQAQLYRTAACAIFPAEATPLLQAKCSVKLATTLLHGVPVVASAVGEQAAYGAEGAAQLLPATATPEAFAAAVAHVLDAPAARVQLRQQAQARLLARYRWATLGARLESFYAQLLA